MFALATIPMIGFVGAAIDYSRANSAKSAMQAAADSVALMLSRDAANLTAAQMNAKAIETFKALLNRPELSGISVVPTLTGSSGGRFKLNLTATGNVPTSFTKIFAKDHLDVTVASEVVWGTKKLELALALDNTGSMAANNKMVELKKAVKNLLHALKQAAKSDIDVKVAIVPFAQEVNVGISNIGATWIRWTEWEASNGNGGGNGNGNGGGNGGVCILGWCWNGTSWVQSSGGGSGNGSSNHSAWNGCVMDREQDYDVLNTAPTATIQATLFPAKQAINCPVALLPLTPIHTNYGTLVSKVESMNPVGMTNVTIGLAWAWHALTPNSPLPEGSAPSPDTDKVIVLLTDGDNTLSRFSSNMAEIDARTKKVCDNVKAAGIKIYTVRVIEGNASLLQQCASKPDMYFNVQNASQLDSVFNQIGQNLGNLRIAR